MPQHFLLRTGHSEGIDGAKIFQNLNYLTTIIFWPEIVRRKSWKENRTPMIKYQIVDRLRLRRKCFNTDAFLKEKNVAIPLETTAKEFIIAEVTRK